MRPSASTCSSCRPAGNDRSSDCKAGSQPGVLRRVQAVQRHPAADRLSPDRLVTAGRKRTAINERLPFPLHPFEEWPDAGLYLPLLLSPFPRLPLPASAV